MAHTPADRDDAGRIARGVSPETVVSRRVRAVRRQHGWTQQDLAQRLGKQMGREVDRATIAKLEAIGSGARTRRASISVEELVALAAALHVSPAHLLDPLTDEPVAVTPEWNVPVSQLRPWLRGLTPLDPSHTPIFVLQLPAEEVARLLWDAQQLHVDRSADRAVAEQERYLRSLGIPVDEEDDHE